MSYASEVLADSPIVWYRCQEGSGNLADSSGHSLTSVLQTGSPTYGVTSPITSDAGDKAITIAGATQWFSTAYSSLLDIGDVGSIACWILRGNTSTAEQTIIIRDQGLYLGLITNQLFIAKTNVAGIAKSTVTITDTTTWHHCVVTKNGATVKQYIDGVDVTGTVTNATWANGTTPDLRIGSDATGTPFTGSIDEIIVFGTALSSARVSAQFAAATAIAEKQTFYMSRRKIVFSGNMR